MTDSPEAFKGYDEPLLRSAKGYLYTRELRIGAVKRSVDPDSNEHLRVLSLAEAGVLRVVELFRAEMLKRSLESREVVFITRSIENYDRFLPSVAETVSLYEET